MDKVQFSNGMMAQVPRYTELVMAQYPIEGDTVVIHDQGEGTMTRYRVVGVDDAYTDGLFRLTLQKMDD